MGSLGLPSPPRGLKNTMKMKLFGLNETKLFHFHGIFKKIVIRLVKRPHAFIHLSPLSRNPGSTPGFVWKVCVEKTCLNDELFKRSVWLVENKVVRSVQCAK